jgi:trans-aconitate 2-methyltransferase
MAGRAATGVVHARFRGFESYARGAVPDWDPERYLKFRAERRQPYEDLVALVRPRAGMRVVDLGCGPGELTVDLAQRLDAQAVVGIDNSAAMLARAAELTDPRVSFVQADVATHPLDAFDLVFSNAALHWIPDHDALFARLRSALRPGGQLAVQMPNNFAQSTHVTAIDVASEEPFATALGHERMGASVATAEHYALLLHGLGFREQVVTERIYVHELADRDAVVEWVRGTMLRWYATKLGRDLYAKFAARYAERLLPQLADDKPYAFTYRRVLLWAAL